MKALVYSGPRDLKLEDWPDPIPQNDQVRIKVRATGICGSDVHGYLGLTGRRTAPMIMGHEFAGEVDQLGPDVLSLKIGDRVTVQPTLSCGKCADCLAGDTNICRFKTFLGAMKENGSMAEYICVTERLVLKLPDLLTFDQGAMIEPLAVAWRGVSQAGNLADRKVLIVGAGTIGLLTLQSVLLQKPARVFISDLMPSRLDLATRLGADVAINPAQSDLQSIIQAETAGLGVDVAIEAVGAAVTVNQAMQALRIRGICVWIGNSMKMINIDMQNVVTRELRISGAYIYTHQQFIDCMDLLANGKIQTTPLITGHLPLVEGPGAFAMLADQPENHLKIILTS